MKPVVNFLIKVLVFVLACAVTALAEKTLFSNIEQPWLLFFIRCFIFIITIFIGGCIVNTIKSFKDPDVKAASMLGMDVFTYRKYNNWYAEWKNLMKKYGDDSKEANQYFNSFFCQIKNKNKWDRFISYKIQEINERVMSEYRKLTKE